MNIRSLIFGAFLTVAAVLAATYLPLSNEEERIVAVKDISEVTVLHGGGHLEQRMRPKAGTYSGIVLFTDEDALQGRLTAKVIDKDGVVITQSSQVQSSFLPGGDTLKITFQTKWFSLDGSEYVLDITRTSGADLHIKTVPHETTRKQLMSLSLVRPALAPFGLRQGITIGAAFFLAVLLLQIFKTDRTKMIAAILILILFSPLAVLGYWYPEGDLGIADWDYYFTLHDSYRSAILQHHTFPFWNPYICGGTAGLADPEFPIFSPTFLLELIFGIPLGIKAAITLSVAVGAVGMLMLSRKLGRSVEAGIIAALVVAFSTVNLLEITEGHVNVMAAMWIPWIFWSWLAVYMGKMKPVVCGIFLALTFLGGGIYLLMYTALAFIALMFLVSEHRRAVIATIQSGVWALGLAAFKIIPVLFWLKQFPDDAYASSSYTLPWIGDILFGRHLHGAEVIPHQMSGWHEYGAYIGYIVFGLALVGASRSRSNRTIRALTIASIAALLLSTAGPFLEPLFDVLWFFPRSSISRFILFAVIPLGFLAAYGLDHLASKVPSRSHIIRTLMVGLIGLDILSLTYQLSEQAFVLPHVVPSIVAAPYPIVYTTQRFDPEGSGSRDTRSYDAYRAGYGVMAYCSVLGPKPAVATVFDEQGDRIAYAQDADATVQLVSWTYNTVQLRISTPRSTTIILNQNYAEGWKANGNNALSVDNKVGTRVLPGTSTLTFRYTTPGLLSGVVVTVGCLIVLILSRLWYPSSKRE
jgi:hypothetical protein